MDQELSAYAQFLQHMQVYETLKFAIRHEDIGLFRRIFPQCAVLFTGANKQEHAFLFVYDMAYTDFDYWYRAAKSNSFKCTS